MSVTTPRIDAVRYAAVEDRLSALLETRHDTLVLGGEAILALEALARGAGGPGMSVVNVVSGPYAAMMGGWLGASGAEVRTVAAEDRRAIDADALRVALAQRPADVVCVVHAEAATGVVNPLAELAAVTHDAGAVLLVDAVASVGAEPLEIDALDLDAVIIGPQKAMAGPAGVCGVFMGPRAWGLLERNPAAPRDSILSLLDVRDRWTAAGRAALPFVPHHLELAAFDDALARLEAEGMAAVVDRHRRARAAARAGAVALGLELWVASEVEAAAVATLVRPPSGHSVSAILAQTRLPAPLEPAPGPLADSVLRVMHAGGDASLEAVLRSLAALEDALARRGIPTDRRAAFDLAEAAWQG